MKRIAIVGGGIAGLSAAYHFERIARSKGRAVDARLFEAGAAAGGVIQTERVEGFLLDTGPDSLFKGKPAAIDLAKELGLAEELLEARAQELSTLIHSGGRLRPLPPGLESLAPARLLPFFLSGLISPFGKIRMMAEPFIEAKRDGSDESVAAFVRRRFGDEAARKIAGPLLAGIHAGDPEKLSIRSTFGRLCDIEAKHGSLTLGMRAARRSAPGGPGPRAGAPSPPFVSFRSGIRRIVDALIAAIRDVRIETGREVSKIERLGAGGWRLVGRDGAEMASVDACVVAVPAPKAALLLDAAAPNAASALAKVRYASSATVFLGYHASATGPLPASTGFLIPFTERRRIFGCSFVSNKYEGRAPDGCVLLRAFVGGAVDESSAELPDEPMAAMVRSELRDLIGLTAEPILVRIARWPKANPQYEIGHHRIVEAVDRDLASSPGLFVTGSGLRGVGIPDGVAQGRTVAEQATAFLSRP